MSTSALEKLGNLVDLEVLASDGELTDALDDNGFLALLFEVKLNLILSAGFDLLGAVLLANLFNLGHFKQRRFTKQTKNEVVANEDDTLLLLLDLLSELRKEREVNSGVRLV
jgi:hypothetical protein